MYPELKANTQFSSSSIPPVFNTIQKLALILTHLDAMKSDQNQLCQNPLNFIQINLIKPGTRIGHRPLARLPQSVNYECTRLLKQQYSVYK